MSEVTDIPAISQSLPPDVRKPLERMRQQLQLLLGLRGDGFGRAVTVRDIQRGNVPGGPGGSIPIGGGDDEIDLTPPPNVSGLEALAGSNFVGALWDPPIYSLGRGHAQPNIYAARRAVNDASQPTFGDAQRIEEAGAQLTIATIASEFNIRWHIWAKWQTRDGVESVSPAGGTNGIVVTTGQDVTQLLEVLTGMIRAEQLHAALGQRIDLIDGPASLAGSVANRLLQEAQARGAAILSERTARESADQTLAQAIDALAASSGDAAALVAEEASARASADEALSSSLNLVAATVDGHTAAIAQEASTRANQAGHLGALWTVRMTVGNIAGGFGISGTSAGEAGATIDFGIRANRFFIAAPEGVAGVPSLVPFSVITVPTTTAAGEVLPVGVYMEAAYVKGLEAVLGRFTQAIIGDALIMSVSAGKLTAGTLDVGMYMQSSGYVSGNSGFRINGNGSAEFNNVLVRGTVYASAGEFSGAIYSPLGLIGGIQIDAGGVQSANYTAGSTGQGFRLNADGTAVLPATSVRGKLRTEQLEVGSVTASVFAAAASAGASNFTYPSGGNSAQLSNYPLLAFTKRQGAVHVSGWATLTIRVDDPGWGGGMITLGFSISIVPAPEGMPSYALTYYVPAVGTVGGSSSATGKVFQLTRTIDFMVPIAATNQAYTMQTSITALPANATGNMATPFPIGSTTSSLTFMVSSKEFLV